MILQTTTFWRDQDNLDVAISFNRYQCRVQNGTDDSMISFSVSGIENAQIVKESLTKIVKELEDYIDAH
jgi:hypothetical protein